MFKKLLILSLTIIYSTASALAVTSPGTTSMNFLRIEVGGKASGMGGAFSAQSDDGTAVYWNPAGMYSQKHKQVSLMHLNWFEGINYQFASYVHPTKNKGAFGIGISYLTTGEIDSYDNTGAKLDNTVNASDTALTLSYSKEVSGVDAGINIKLLQEKLADESAIAFAGDLGLIYSLKTGVSPLHWIGQELKLSFVAQNIGPKIKYNAEEDPLPSNYIIGLSQKFFRDILTFNIDLNSPSDNDMYINTGADYKMTEWLAIRAGYKIKSNVPQHDIQPGPTAGIGLGNEYVTVDYAFVPYSVLGVTHRIGINYKFGKSYEKNLMDDKVEKHIKKGKRYYHNKDYIYAYKEFNNVLMIDPVNRDAEKYMKEIKLKLSEIKLEKYLARARKHIENEELIEAKELLDAIQKLYPEDKDTKGYLARIHTVIQEQKVMRTESIFKQGLEFYKLKQHQDAISLWEKVLIISPEHQKSKEHIELAKLELDKIEKETKAKRQAQMKKRAGEYFRAGMNFYKAKSWEKAKKAFDQCKNFNPDHPEVGTYLNETNTQLAKVYFKKGMDYYKDKKLKKSLELFTKATDLNPNDKEIREQFEKTKSEIKLINIQKAEEFNREGLKAYGLGNLKEAIAAWKKALEFDPENDKIKNNLKRAKNELNKK